MPCALRGETLLREVSVRADLESQLAEWAVVKKQLSDGIISVEEYEKWKTNWPATSSIHTDEPIKWKN